MIGAIKKFFEGCVWLGHAWRAHYFEDRDVIEWRCSRCGKVGDYER